MRAPPPWSPRTVALWKSLYRPWYYCCCCWWWCFGLWTITSTTRTFHPRSVGTALAWSNMPLSVHDRFTRRAGPTTIPSGTTTSRRHRSSLFGRFRTGSISDDNDNTVPDEYTDVESRSDDDENDPENPSARAQPRRLPLFVVETIALDDQTVTVRQLQQSASAAKEMNDSYATSTPTLRFRSSAFYLAEAALVGVATGISVAVFKLSIEFIREVCYNQSFLYLPAVRSVVPAVGGVAVGILYWAGRGAFPPGLRGTVQLVDQQDRRGLTVDTTQKVKTQIDFLRKSTAAVFTLGTGCSLGPEGPCVEIGMNVARGCMDVKPEFLSRPRPHWNVCLLNCGAAAGVAAGFNAPLAGVFFTLEVMQSALNGVRQEEQEKQTLQGNNSDLNAASNAVSATENITPILLASVLSALVARTILGDTLVLSLSEYSLETPLIELPLYLLLGVISGFVAFSFSKAANWSQAFFSGEVGGESIQSFMSCLPEPVKPVIGGFACGLVGLVFPQILFFGYETLNSLLANASLPTSLLFSLLIVKTIMTAVSAGSGLVGGTFAPSLFLGAMVGAAFHNVATIVFQTLMTSFPWESVGVLSSTAAPVLVLADVPAYAMVGAASVLAALFRAPLTASLLLFELTRDYDVILPLMASAGVGSLVGDILEDKVQNARRTPPPNVSEAPSPATLPVPPRRRDKDSVSWGDLADKKKSSTTRSVK
jgi:H+/Cl- antiporter ClcA